MLRLRDYSWRGEGGKSRDHDGVVIIRGRKDHFPWHFLYLRPLPQGQGSFRPTFAVACTG